MKNAIPYGVSQYKPDDCFAKKSLEDKIRAAFEGYGYLRVDLPTLDNFELFNGIVGATDTRRMFKLTDNDGALLALRPDPTLQVCRMAAAMGESVSKLYYTVNSFEYLPAADGLRSREFPQAGIELIGESGEAGDAEVIAVAIDSLLKAGLTDFLIELGHIDFLYGILSGAGIDGAARKELRKLIDIKDSLGVSMLLDKHKVDAKSAAAIMSVTTLFGGAEVLDKAEKLAAGSGAVAYLRKVYTVLKAAGYEKYISIDLGLVRKRDYYSGIVFRGFCRDLGGVPILSGGRYDRLMDNFGRSTPATGMSIGIGHLMTALKYQGAPKVAAPVPDIAYIAVKADASAEHKWATELRTKGKRVSKMFCNEKEFKKYCKENGIEGHVI